MVFRAEATSSVVACDSGIFLCDIDWLPRVANAAYMRGLERI